LATVAVAQDPPPVPSRSPTCHETIIDETPFYQKVPSAVPIEPATCIATSLESYQVKIKVECNFAKIRAMPEDTSTMLIRGYPSFFVYATNRPSGPYYGIRYFRFGGTEEESTYYEPSTFDGTKEASNFYLYENECMGDFIEIEVDQWLEDGRYFRLLKMDGVTRLVTSSIGSTHHEGIKTDWQTGRNTGYVMSTLGIKDFFISTFGPLAVPSRWPTCQETVIDETPFYQRVPSFDPIEPTTCIPMRLENYQVKIKVECNIAKIRTMPEDAYSMLIIGWRSFFVSVRNSPSRPYYTISMMPFGGSDEILTYYRLDGTQIRTSIFFMYENDCIEGGFIDIEVDQWLEKGRYFKMLKIDGVTRLVTSSVGSNYAGGSAVGWNTGLNQENYVMSSLAIKDFSIATFAPPSAPSRSPTCQETLIDETPFYQQVPSIDPIHPTTCIATSLESYHVKIKVECNFAKIKAMPENTYTMLINGYPSFSVSARNYPYAPYYMIIFSQFHGSEEESIYYELSTLDGTKRARNFYLYENDCTYDFMDIEVDQWLEDGRYFRMLKLDGVTRLVVSSIGSDHYEGSAVGWKTGFNANNYVVSSLGIKDFSIATFVEPTTTPTTTTSAVVQGPVVPSRSPTCHETLIDETPFYQRAFIDPIYPATCIARRLESYQVKIKVECNFAKIKAMPEETHSMLISGSSSFTVRVRNSRTLIHPYYSIIINGFLDLDQEYFFYAFDGTQQTRSNFPLFENQCTEGGFMDIEFDQWLEDGRYFRMMKIDGVKRLVVISSIVSDFSQGSSAVRWHTDATGFVYSNIAIKDLHCNIR
jgi:hypothetical protein